MESAHSRPRRLAFIALTAALAILPFRGAWAQDPNIIFLAGDDWAWPYYGFMQRWMTTMVTGTCSAESDNPGATCTGDLECPNGVCESDLVGDRPTQRSYEWKDRFLLLQDIPDASRPPLDQLITPAMDWLAANGNFWPWTHTSGSMSQPGFCIQMTGLYPGDWVFNSSGKRTISPTLPEVVPSTYFTMLGGKWQYALSHAYVNDERRAPWDREMVSGGNAGERGRMVMFPVLAGDPQTQAEQGLALERIKNFLACVRCTDPSKCEQPPPQAEARPDSPRMAPRAEPGQCTPEAFFIQFSPFIPHLNYRYGDTCPYYPRNAAQCALEPWKTHSLYCNHPSGFDWSCDNYAAAMEAIFRPPVGKKFPRRKMEYLKHINTFDRAVDEILVWLKCPEGGNPNCGEDLLSNTVLIHHADHGFELRPSKGNWKEHSFKTPDMMYDGRGNSLPESTDGCGSPPEPGCRKDFAHAIDVRATLKDLSGGTFDCDLGCPPGDGTCESACPAPRPDGLSRYSEGRSLASPTARTCNHAPPDTPDATWVQCLFGREERNQGLATIQDGWYVLAEIKDAQNLSHFCKLYRHCGKRTFLYDLQSDPNERTHLLTISARKAGRSFCDLRGDDLVQVLRQNVIDKGWFEDCFDTSNGLPLPPP